MGAKWKEPISWQRLRRYLARCSDVRTFSDCLCLSSPTSIFKQVPPGPRHRSSEIDPKRCAVEQIARGEAIRLWTTAIVYLHSVVFDRLSAFCRRFRKLTWTAESLQHRFHCTSLNVREISSGGGGERGGWTSKDREQHWDGTEQILYAWHPPGTAPLASAKERQTWTRLEVQEVQHPRTTFSMERNSQLQISSSIVGCKKKKHQNTQKLCTMSYHISSILV